MHSISSLERKEVVGALKEHEVLKSPNPPDIRRAMRFRRELVVCYDLGFIRTDGNTADFPVEVTPMKDHEGMLMPRILTYLCTIQQFYQYDDDGATNWLGRKTDKTILGEASDIEMPGMIPEFIVWFLVKKGFGKHSLNTSTTS